MYCLTKVIKLSFEYVLAAGANKDPDDHEDRIPEHSLGHQDKPPTNQAKLEHEEHSNQKSILERPFLQGVCANPPSQGLVVHLPEAKVRKRITERGNLLYDLYAPRSYLIPVHKYTFYLCIKEIRVTGKGYILFKQKLNTKIRGKRKAIVRNTQLHVPIPSDFGGIIEADQQLGTLKIIPSKKSIIKLYHFVNSDPVPPKTVGVYNGKTSEIAKQIPKITS